MASYKVPVTVSFSGPSALDNFTFKDKDVWIKEEDLETPTAFLQVIYQSISPLLKGTDLEKADHLRINNDLLMTKDDVYRVVRQGTSIMINAQRLPPQEPRTAKPGPEPKSFLSQLIPDDHTALLGLGAAVLVLLAVYNRG